MAARALLCGVSCYAVARLLWVAAYWFNDQVLMIFWLLK